VRTAVVAYNLGGPDSLEAVRPFLFNLFNDPAIIRAPLPVRWCLARFLSGRRAPVAREIYARIGGKSPILEETQRQAAALQAALGDPDIRVFVAMRYWRPQVEEVVAEVAAFGPERVVLLPLYPQFSTTTTGSFVRAWNRAAASALRSVTAASICCYPDEAGFVEALAALTRKGWTEASVAGTPRILFSAHGLPKKFVTAGDPYQHQVERTVAAVASRLGIADLDHVVCYQSRVGPLEWLGPYTDAEVRRGGADRRPLVVVPVAFVSEHSETLVELDIEYRALAAESGVPVYVRVPTVGTEAAYIAGLARSVEAAMARPPGVAPAPGGALCPPRFAACPCAGTP
jgi:ferrochelatase